MIIDQMTSRGPFQSQPFCDSVRRAVFLNRQAAKDVLSYSFIYFKFSSLAVLSCSWIWISYGVGFLLLQQGQPWGLCTLDHLQSFSYSWEPVCKPQVSWMLVATGFTEVTRAWEMVTLCSCPASSCGCAQWQSLLSSLLTASSTGCAGYGCPRRFLLV